MEPDDFPMEARRRTLPYEVARDLPDYLLDNGEHYSLFVADVAAIRMREVSRDDPDREIGGVLLGRHFQRGKRVMVLVEEALQLPSSSTSVTHYDFDSSALLQLHGRLGEETERYVVGWFHSHVRIGDPFMSSFDTRLHGVHFAKSWYVSAVVGGGQPGWPIGYWRMEKDRLLEISEHYLHMTFADPLGAQAARYFHSLTGEQADLRVFAAVVSGMLKDLGYPPDHPLVKMIATPPVAATIEGKHVGQMGSYFRAFLAIVQIAERFHNAQMQQELADCLKRMKHATSSLESWRVCFFTDKLSSAGMVRGDGGFGFSPGSNRMERWNFVDNFFLDLFVQHGSAIVDGDFIGKSTVALLTEDKCLVIVPPSFGQSANLPVQTIDPSLDLIPLKQELPTPRAMAIRDQSLYVAAGNQIVKFRIHTDLHESENFKLTSAEIEPVASLTWGEEAIPCLIKGHTLLDSEDDAPLFAVKTATGKLALHLFTEGIPLARAGDLPPHASTWHLIQAVVSGNSLFTLFDDADCGQVLEFHYHSLELRRHYIQDVLPSNRKKIYSLVHSADGKRVFVRAGKYVLLIATTGEMEPDWYHTRSLKSKVEL